MATLVLVITGVGITVMVFKLPVLSQFEFDDEVRVMCIVPNAASAALGVYVAVEILLALANVPVPSNVVQASEALLDTLAPAVILVATP